MKSRPRRRSPSVSSISSEKSDGYSSQSVASMASTHDSRRSYATDATGYNSDFSYQQSGSSSKTSIASMVKTTTGLTNLIQSTIAKLKKKGGCPIKVIKQDIKESHGYTLAGAHNTRRLNSVLKTLQKDGKIVKTAKGYKLVPASELRRRRHHRHSGRRRTRRRQGKGKRRRKLKRARRKHRRRRRRRRQGRTKGRKGHGRRRHRRRRRRRHGRKHAEAPTKTAKLRRGVAKLSLKGARPLPGGPAKGGADGSMPEGSSPPPKAQSRLQSRPTSRVPSRTASRATSRNQSPARARPGYQRANKRAKVPQPAAPMDDDYDE